MNINFTNLTKLVKPRGVIHVGANTCQELPLYLSHGIENRIWIEPFVELEFPNGETIIHVAIGDKNDEVSIVYQASNNNESTSLLKPIKHIELYNNISFNINKNLTKIVTLEKIIKNNLGGGQNFNYLVLDIQGMELKALKGLGQYANHFDVIITEAYIDELYEDCGKLTEIQKLLADYEMVEFIAEPYKGWGDAAFIRKDLINFYFCQEIVKKKDKKIKKIFCWGISEK
jgi:FkbM family methyltransferase